MIRVVHLKINHYNRSNYVNILCIILISEFVESYMESMENIILIIDIHKNRLLIEIEHNVSTEFQSKSANNAHVYLHTQYRTLISPEKNYAFWMVPNLTYPRKSLDFSLLYL